ncbi:MAG: hypothetical protein JXR94_12220, partial [Candidatus Hydrogenedentes bacterium]|nr:hypothetical protein [Candidatus Hydrogenedentota bacterium]
MTPPQDESGRRPPPPSKDDAERLAYMETRHMGPDEGSPDEESDAFACVDPGRYRVGGLLGEGGMATVYEGYDTKMGRPVALKVMKADMESRPQMRQRFFYEARLLGDMDHPGIVPVFDKGELPGYGSFYSMKRVHGRTLREILRSTSRREFARSEGPASLLRVFDKV